MDNIDRIVKFNEYKEIQKYLEPISLVPVGSYRKRSKIRGLRISFKMETRLLHIKNT